MPSLASHLKKKGLKTPTPSEPLWKGPEVDGITQSMLQWFLVCRERFRILYVLGLQPTATWNHRLGYGDMWHVCEEVLAGDFPYSWEYALKQFAQEQCKLYPTQVETIDHWYRTCKTQFPEYVKFWAKHPDMKKRTPVFQEEKFAIPYKLPSGRTVLLRGKFDSVDVEAEGKNRILVLQENKTKGDIKEMQLQRQLRLDLQTMFYVTALDLDRQNPDGALAREGVEKHPVRKLRYNVVRRPFSGGRGSITRHKPSKSNPQGESKDEFYQRFLNDYLLVEPEYYFMRWEVPITDLDIAHFKKVFLHPMLEQLCDWWLWISTCAATKTDPFDSTAFAMGKDKRIVTSAVHWMHPFGVYNALIEAGQTDLDDFLLMGNKVGLRQATALFPELA